MTMLAALVSVMAVLLGLLFYRLTSMTSVWKRLGLRYRTPYPVVGNVIEHVTDRKSLGHIMMDVCNQFKNEKIIGFYNFTTPVYLINDVKYAEEILIKEFSKFMNRGQDMKIEERRPLDKHLFSLNGVSWKAVRSKMSPVFTTGKLKGMIQQMDRLFEKTVSDIESVSGDDVKIKDVVELYSVCVRASCVFGQDTSRMDQASEFLSKFRQMGKFDFFRFVGLSLSLWFPKIATKLDLSFFGSQHEGYFVDNLLAAFKERSESKIVKDDLIQAMLELKNTGKVDVKQWTQEDEYLKMDEKHMTKETVVIDDDILVAQSFIFLLAGIETILTTNVMTLVELSRNIDVMDKVRHEVDSVIRKHNRFTFEAIKEMKYLELCIKETLRIYPPVEFINRRSVKGHTFDNGLAIKADEDLLIPVLHFHMDPQFYPEPHRYRPERFEDGHFPPCSYMPFGEGPRICIGMRFSMMEMKMYLSKMIYNYDFTMDAKTLLPIIFDKRFFLRRITSPIYFNFAKRKH